MVSISSKYYILDQREASRVHYLAYEGDSGYVLKKKDKDGKEVEIKREFLGIPCVMEDGEILPTKIRGDYKDKEKQEKLFDSINELKQL